ncbi:hypothetical protein [Streptomyces qinglanensis]|uniref:hypothetical protein n=1 Tax=Streptomyces qinglanensis TaxID=943816 RepID=UPI0009451799|nr:hypothetical protein [Streptomyces qinglanensis]
MSEQGRAGRGRPRPALTALLVRSRGHGRRRMTALGSGCPKAVHRSTPVPGPWPAAGPRDGQPLGCTVEIAAGRFHDEVVIHC